MKSTPFTFNQLQQVIAQYPTPFHIYDAAGVAQTCDAMTAAFSWAPQYRNYYAVKALPNPTILELVHDHGMGMDCSSLAELVLAERIGLRGEQIMFSSNDTPAADFQKAYELGAIINLDDISHIEYLRKTIGTLPELLSFRYNPGDAQSGNDIIGNPTEAKYGLTRPQLFEAYKLAKQGGVSRFGLHTMVASNELRPEYFVATATLMFELARDLQADGINVEFINLGGGFGIPYRPEQAALDLTAVSAGIQNAYETILPDGLRPKLYTECGRYVTGPHGYLVSTVLHRKSTYREYVGLDASMANLMRPGMYGAYHHITVLGKDAIPQDQIYDVTGALCENNDKFAIQRTLPKVVEGDIMVIHDTGAHGHSMGFNYNGMLRSAELLLLPNGSVEMIRRAETLNDYFATLDIA